MAVPAPDLLNPCLLFRQQALGQPYVTQLVLIYEPMLNVYKMYSELISASIATGGPHASKTSNVKLMRSVKKVSWAPPLSEIPCLPEIPCLGCLGVLALPVTPL